MDRGGLPALRRALGVLVPVDEGEAAEAELLLALAAAAHQQPRGRADAAGDDEAEAERPGRDERKLPAQLAGEGIYLILAMTPDGMLRVKPQNLVVGLPIRSAERVS